MSQKKNDMSAFIAAALIMICLGASYFFMPPLLRALANINEWLAYSVGGLFILAFFGVFWIRNHYQKSRDNKHR